MQNIQGLIVFKAIALAVFCWVSTTQAQTLRLEPTMIVDSTGFGQPMVAATLFKPHGWKVSGGISWGQEHACTRGWAVNWSAESPDGNASIAVLPQQGWEQSSEGRAADFNCALMPLSSPEDYLRAIVKQAFPQARILSYRARPDLEQENAHLVGVLIDTGFQRQVRNVAAGEVLVAFDRNGVALRASFATSVEAVHTRTGDGYGPAIENVAYFAQPMFASMGPAESYDATVYEGLRRSIMPDQRWIAQINRHQTTLDGINRRGVAERSRISSKANSEMSTMRQAAWQANQRSSDARAQDFIASLREVQTYNDNSTASGQVELSSQFNHAWRLNDGTYVMTDDALFQPEQVFGISGSALSPSR